MTEPEYPPRRHHRVKPKPEWALTLPQMYRSGASIRQIAAYADGSYGWAHSFLRRHGVTLRPRGGSRKK